MGLYERISNRRQKSGVIGVLKALPSFIADDLYRQHIRPLQPVERYTVWNGVLMSPKRAAVRKFDSFLPSSLREEGNENSEGGEVEFHKEYTRPGDWVVIIGGGRGVTTVHAAWQVERDGGVTVYEGSDDMVDVIQDTVRINEVADRCDIRHSIVGPGFNVYSRGPKGAEHLHPDNLPPCDVLEMDCEGAELDILRHMSIRPEVLIIEVHPRRHTLEPSKYLKALFEVLDEGGYSVEARRSNEGVPLSEAEFDTICHSPLEEHPGAPVIVAVHESSDR